ncbi:MAG: aldolase/citrate lyase family protein [Gemmatimonadota bacterium]|nr:aldolase/citrate lyase family protein [Gemmatimonadota bacterium]
MQQLRVRLQTGGRSIGSWMQIPHASVAEIMGRAGYDWVAADLEHGAISLHQLPDIFRALELGGTLPLARLAQGAPRDCKQALDAGAGGVIIPNIESAQELIGLVAACRWPPAGSRGVGFSRANLFGKNFDGYREEAQAPIIVAMIENVRALQDIEAILGVTGLDALLVGPYDLSASMGLTAQFDHPKFASALDRVRAKAEERGVPCGIHVVPASPEQMQLRINQGFRFLAYSTDAVMLNTAAIQASALLDHPSPDLKG